MNSQGGKPLSNNTWLPLNEFSTKYKVSLSTLRRRIRSGEIEHKFAEGKYWLADRPILKHARKFDYEARGVEEENGKVINLGLETPPSQEVSEEFISGEGLLDSANKLMAELKGAFISVLHEKEDQIMQLKEEIADLRTLVRILEADNERLKSNAKEAAPIDAWLEANFER